MGEKILCAKVAVVGNVNIGKTALARRFTFENFSEKAEPTIGAAYCAKTVPVAEESVRLQIWDTAGMEKYQSIVPLYIRDAKIVLICFDHPKIEHIKSQIKFVHNINAETTIVLVRTKEDLSFSFDIDYVRKTLQEIKDFAENNNYFFFSTSAKTGAGIDTLFSKVAEIAYVNIRGLPKRDYERDNVSESFVKASSDQNIKGCCVIM